MSGNEYNFAGRVALVTGGASGIGAATTHLLRDGGARVASFDISTESVGEGILALRGDVRHSDELGRALHQVQEELGPLDILVCSAAIPGDWLSTTEVTDDEWNRVMAVNASGTFFACRAAIPGMIARGYGRIVNIASIGGKEGNPKMAAYCASKAAVICLTKSLGKDLAGTGVLVNCVTPGPTATPVIAGLSQEQIDYTTSRVPLGRMAEPHEVATLIAFLASEDVTFSTGACFDISGGRAVY